MLTPWKESYDQPRQHIKKRRHYFINKGLSHQGYCFSSGRVCMWELDYKESWAPRIDAFELWCWRRLLRAPWLSARIFARRSNKSILKETVLNFHWKDWCWNWNSNTLAICCEELTHLRWPWCCERLKAGGEGEGRGWDGLMASPTQWTWVWVNSDSWWRTGRPGVLHLMGSQSVEHDWATELNWSNASTNGNLLSFFCGISFILYCISD